MADLTPGRELDERVARLVWPDPDDPKAPLWIGPNWTRFLGPSYSTDREAAMSLLDGLAGRGWGWQITCYLDVQYRYEVVVNEGRNVTDGGVSVVAVCLPTLPLAICAAVLAALEDA